MAMDYPVGGAAAVVQQQLHLQDPTTTGLLDGEFPRLHSALTLSRREVDALGGSHLPRAGHVRAREAHAENLAPLFIAANAIPDAALE